MWKKSIQVGLAYVGIIVGAGLSSGQDLMQYFISFGKMGLVGVVLLAVLNIIFGRIIIADTRRVTRRLAKPLSHRERTA